MATRNNSSPDERHPAGVQKNFVVSFTQEDGFVVIVASSSTFVWKG